jgi:integrase
MTIEKKDPKNIKPELIKIVKSKTGFDQKINQLAFLITENQSQTKSILKQGFVGIALQNKELWKQNQELKEQLKILGDEVQFLSQELQNKLEEERLAEEKRIRRKNRKRLPKREPITKEIYQFLIREAESLPYSNSFRGARLRLALALLLVTGIRIGELRTLKISQVKTLFDKSWIAIDRKKRGPASHKAFLTNEGKIILKDRRKDLEMVSYFKNDHSFIFTAQDSHKPLGQDAFNNIINRFIRSSANKLEGQPLVRSHSFRIGFITQLWKDTNDIEFVRQAIGHVKIDTTSQYVERLSDQERQERMLELGKPSEASKTH